MFVLAVLTPASNLVPAQINICDDGWTTSGINVFVLAVVLISRQHKSILTILKYLQCKTKMKNNFIF